MDDEMMEWLQAKAASTLHDLFRIFGAVALFAVFVIVVWMFAWKMIFSKIRFFQEIFGKQKTEDEKQRKRAEQASRARRRRSRRMLSSSNDRRRDLSTVQ